MLALVLLVVLAPAPTWAQHQTEPHPLDTFLTNVLNFTRPTGIRGTIRYIDLDGPVLWLNWNQRSDDRLYSKQDGKRSPVRPYWRCIHTPPIPPWICEPSGTGLPWN